MAEHVRHTGVQAMQILLTLTALAAITLLLGGWAGSEAAAPVTEPESPKCACAPERTATRVR